MVEPDFRSVALSSRKRAIVDFSPFVRLVLGRGPVRYRHEFTHCIHENGTARKFEPLGLIRPRFDRVLWLSRNAQALALLSAATTLR